MPRPKRSKITPSVPTRVPLSSLRAKSAFRDISPHSSGRSTTNSDDSKGIVTTIKTGLKLKSGPFHDLRMSGALAPEDVQGSTRLKPPGGRERAALSQIAREADHAKEVDARKKQRSELVVERRTQNQQEIAQEVVPSSMLEAQEHAVPKATAAKNEQFQTRTVERIKPVPAPSRNLHATPIAESSILALANFKRRPRQPSILQIGREDDSIPESDLDEMLDEFQPDDESTPFHVSRMQPTLYPTPGHPAATPTSSERLSSSTSRKRKRTPPEVQVPRSQSSGEQVSSSPPEMLELPTPDPFDILAATPMDPEPELPSDRTRKSPTHDIFSDTMAPPQSSSALNSPAQPPPPPSACIIYKKAPPNPKTKRKQPLRTTDAASKAMATASSPAPRKKDPLKPISTATLQTLLPRRRPHHPRNDFDIPSSPLSTTPPAEDEDELSFAALPPRKKASKPLKPATAGKARGKSVAASTTKATAKANKTKPNPSTTTTHKPQPAGVARTYSRRTSDQENASLSRSDSLPPTSPSASSPSSGPHAKDSGAAPQRKSAELKTLARKFQEVDAWEMEFEEVTASSSSPRDAR